MTRRELLASSFLFAQPPAKRWNILWVSCEDSSPDFGCYGDTYARTPNVDRLATQGLRYTHAFSTYGVCAPCRSSIITAMYPATTTTRRSVAIANIFWDAMWFQIIY